MSAQDSTLNNLSTDSARTIENETEQQASETVSTSDNAPLQDNSTQGPSSELLERAKVLRSQIRESFAKATMAMMALPRYRSQTIADLDQMVFNPLIRNRIAFAYASSDKPEPESSTEASSSHSIPMDDMAGIAIWASVSEEVDAKIREQISSGVFPIKLKANEWDSGEINWLFDVIAPSQKLTAQVIRNLKQVVKSGDLNIHPLVAKLVDSKALEAMGAKRQSDTQAEAQQTEQQSEEAVVDEGTTYASADQIKH